MSWTGWVVVEVGHWRDILGGWTSFMSGWGGGGGGGGGGEGEVEVYFGWVYNF